MAEQKKIDKSKRSDKPQPQTEKKVTEKGKKLKEDMGKLIDEIDDILEENAEEFVKTYVQRGGE